MTTRQFIRFVMPAAVAAAMIATPGVAQAKVSASVSGQLLSVRGGKGSDRIVVACVGGQVKIDRKDPRTGPVPCAAVSEVDVIAGGGNDRVDLHGVGSANGFGQRDLPGGFGHGTGAAAELGPGNDTYIGGTTAFNLVLAGTGNDNVTGGHLRDSLQGGPGNDTLNGSDGNDLLVGGTGNDKLNGGAGNDLLSGNAGNDVLIGGPGDDLLGGGLGDDQLFGGPGNDTLIGGPGKDKLNGGPGNNTLVQDSPTKK